MIVVCDDALRTHTHRAMKWVYILVLDVVDRGWLVASILFKLCAAMGNPCCLPEPRQETVPAEAVVLPRTAPLPCRQVRSRPCRLRSLLLARRALSPCKALGRMTTALVASLIGSFPEMPAISNPRWSLHRRARSPPRSQAETTSGIAAPWRQDSWRSRRQSVSLLGLRVG